MVSFSLSSVRLFALSPLTALISSHLVVHNYNQLMKDFPLNDLLAATDLSKIAGSITAIFRHISTKLKLAPYPIRRALPLVQAISKDFNDALLRVLGTGKLMFMSWEGFEATMKELGEVFAAWDENLKEFVAIARDCAFHSLVPLNASPLI